MLIVHGFSYAVAVLIWLELGNRQSITRMLTTDSIIYELFLIWRLSRDVWTGDSFRRLMILMLLITAKILIHKFNIEEHFNEVWTGTKAPPKFF